MMRWGSSVVAGPAVGFVALLLVAVLTTPQFLASGNLANLILQSCVIAIVAIGATFVILTGQIDLSPGSMVALLTVTLAILVKHQGWPLEIAIPAILMAGGLLGAVNGILTAYLNIPSFIVTLATLSAFSGIAFMPTSGTPIFQLSADLQTLFYGSFLLIPLPLYYLAFAYGAAWLYLRHMPGGRRLYAAGSNPTAARLSGIDVRRVQALAFIVAGVCYAASAILFAARLNSGSPNYGSGLELSAIAATVIGGVALAGGRGSVVGTLLGALTMTIIQNVMNLNGIVASLQSVIIGGIIVVAVGLDGWRQAIGNFWARRRTSAAGGAV